METDQKKLLLAVTVLVLALSMLGFQVFRRIDRDARRASGVSDPGVMIEEAVTATADAGIAWAAPGDLNDALAVNPFLRPPGAQRPSTLNAARVNCPLSRRE